MPATLAFNSAPSGGQKAGTTVTITVAGHTASTNYVCQVAYPHGGTQNINFKTDGSGAASITFVPSVSGSYVCTTVLASPATVATASLNAGGHG